MGVEGCKGPVVVKISGSLVYPPRIDYISRLVDVAKKIHGGGCRLAIVTGGGGLARSYINVLRALGTPEALLDEAGIEASRLNASLLAKAFYPLSKPYPQETLGDVLDVFLQGLIPVAGGFQPGQSTNAVAAVIAEALGAEVLLNGLNGVEGIYSEGPGSGRLLRRVSYSEVEAIVERVSKASAGGYTLWDRVALEVVKRSRLKIVFFDARNPENILKAMRGEVGSIVSHDADT